MVAFNVHGDVVNAMVACERLKTGAPVPSPLPNPAGATAAFFHCDSYSGSNDAVARRLMPAARSLVGAPLGALA
jgi:hypothetical protein